MPLPLLHLVGAGFSGRLVAHVISLHPPGCAHHKSNPKCLMPDLPQMLRSLWNIKSSTDFRPRLIVDVGACTGTSGLYGLFKEPDPLYLLIEPQSEFNSRLERYMVGKTHRILNCCLAASRGTAEFKIAPNKDSSHLALPGASFGPTVKTISVPVDTLDSLVEENLPAAAEKLIDMVVKIDVQGAELQVLQGGIGTLSKHNAVLIVEIGTGRDEAIRVFSLLDSLGYVLVDCFDFVKFKGAHRITSQLDAVFAKKTLRIAK